MIPPRYVPYHQFPKAESITLAAMAGVVRSAALNCGKPKEPTTPSVLISERQRPNLRIACERNENDPIGIKILHLDSGPS